MGQTDKNKPEPTMSLSQSQYETLGRNMEAIVTSGYFSRFKLYRVSFARGVFFGVGSALGATIILAVIVWFLSLFSELPFIGDIIQAIETSTK